MRWAFWRKEQQQPQRALPDDVGLPKAYPTAAAHLPDRDTDPSAPLDATAGATSSADAGWTYDVPMMGPARDLDRSAVAAAGPDLAAHLTGTPAEPTSDPRAAAAAATGALAARLPALSGIDGAAAYDEPEDELLHAYAELLAGRAARRSGADHDDLVAVAHLAAAAAAVGAAGEPVLLLLVGVPAAVQLRAASHLLAQTADDGAAPLDQLAHEVRALFGPPG